MSTLKIEEKVAVNAQPDRVFKFLVDPEQVVRCLPGAGYDGKEADDTFLGHIKVKVGPVVTNFHGKARMEDLDPATRRVRIIGEGKDQAGGGSAKLVMLGSVEPGADGSGAELKVEADVEIAGRLVSFGRGMIQSVSAQLFKQFSARIRAALEETGEAPSVAPAAPPAASTATAPVAVPDAPVAPTTSLAPQAPPAAPAKVHEDQEALSIIPLILRAIWDTITRFVRRLVGRHG